MRDICGIDVIEMHQALAENPGRTGSEKVDFWISRSSPMKPSGPGLVDEVRSYLGAGFPLPNWRYVPDRRTRPLRIPETLPGNCSKSPRRPAASPAICCRPLPNTLYTRDTTCWTLWWSHPESPLLAPARHEETILTTSIYKFPPDFVDAEFDIWWGDPTVHHGSATREGGDVMPIGNGAVLIGMSERTSHQAITQLAIELFKKECKQNAVIVAGMPKLAVGHAPGYGVYVLRSRPGSACTPKIMDQVDGPSPSTPATKPRLPQLG